MKNILIKMIAISLTGLVPLELASAQYRLTGMGYPVPQSDSGVIEIKNHESFSVYCTIEAHGLAKSSHGQGPLEGRVKSLPVVKTLQSNREVEVRFGFSTPLAKIRNAWGDPTAILTSLSGQSGSFMPDCVPESQRTLPPPQGNQAIARVLNTLGVDVLHPIPGENSVFSPADLVPKPVLIGLLNVFFNHMVSVVHSHPNGSQIRIPYLPSQVRTNEIRDVHPTDWFFAALDSLCSRYGACHNVSANGVFSSHQFGNRAALNNLLNTVLGVSQVVDISEPYKAVTFAEVAVAMEKTSTIIISWLR